MYFRENVIPIYVNFLSLIQSTRLKVSKASGKRESPKEKNLLATLQILFYTFCFCIIHDNTSSSGLPI